ncbi:MAG: glycosyltransferase family 2 protein [Spirochaetota bacterium]|nr:MAG: glycosyltransferase family 2 protein [Spirochaetota bacterium]
MTKLVVYYRVSDTPAYKDKKKPVYVNNETCLANFLKNFCPENLHVIADSVNDQTGEFLNKIRKKYAFDVEHVQNKSGSKTFSHVFHLALQNMDGDIVYFVEDDYLHLPRSKELLLEAFKETEADYVTLYDHPDKYVNSKDGGPNPFIKHGGELTRVIKTSSSHWKKTNSTTLTFAARVRTLREDQKEWKRCVSSNVPNDFLVFVRLNKSRFFYRPFKRKRILIHPVPGRATHGEADFLTPFCDWESVAELKKKDSS